MKKKKAETRNGKAAQLMKPEPRKTKPTRQTRQHRLPPGSVRYTEMKGRTVERIEVSLSSDYHCVSVRFEDKTDFTVEIDTRLVLTALHSDWKTGNMRILRRWPAMEE